MKKFLTAVFIGGIALAATAEVTFPFEVTTPTWTKIAQGTSEKGANIRKSPSATAPRLMYNEYQIAMDCPAIPQSQWSTRPVKGNWLAATFGSYDTAPVLSEKDGWVQLDLSCPHLGPGWVSTKYCIVTDIKPITRQNAGVCVKFLDGDKSDYFIDVEMNDMESEITYTIGKLVNGLMISHYMLCTTWHSSEYNNGKVGIYQDENGMPGTYWYTEPDANYNYVYLHASELTPEMISAILKYAEPMENGNIVTYMTPSGNLGSMRF